MVSLGPSPLYTFHERVSFQVPSFLQKLFLFPFDVSYWGGNCTSGWKRMVFLLTLHIRE